MVEECGHCMEELSDHPIEKSTEAKENDEWFPLRHRVNDLRSYGLRDLCDRRRNTYARRLGVFVFIKTLPTCSPAIDILV